MDRIFVEGHRGYCAKYPENTLISFEAALDEEILAAANGDGESDAVYLPSVKRNRSGALEGKGLLSSAQMEDLETLLKDTIRKAAGEMYAGCASRTPDASACRYCRVREACGARAAD